MSAKIKDIDALEILDSRGNPTVSVRITLDDGSIGEASVPSGASTGEFEAIELRDGGQRYNGKGVTKAVNNVRSVIREALVGQVSGEQKKIDTHLLALDGTENKSKLGANALLGTSLAYAQASAAAKKIDLFESINAEQGNGLTATLLPVPLINVINGGAHADNSLDIQEFMIVPVGAPSFSEAIRMSTEVFHKLGSLIKNDGYSTGVGDEGGYAPRLESMDRAFELLMKAIEKCGYRPGVDISLALDVAASELVEEGGEFKYNFAKSELGTFSSSEVISMYEKWIAKYPIISIEDGLDENDWAGWKELSTRLGSKVQLVGDDLFVTNTKRLQRGINENVANSILIKVNQIGTLSETIDAINLAREAKYTNVISHRSGETADTIIADLAVAMRSGQIKTGSVCRGERTEKYNRLLWIERKLGSKAEYRNPFV
jgi:enolase